MKKLITQIFLCLALSLVCFTASVSGVEPAEKFIDAISTKINQQITKEDVKATVAGVKIGIKDISDKATAVVAVIAENPHKYGEPIDIEPEGTIASVYAVSGGTVIATGTNEEMGNYIVISHGYDAESIYGNMETVEVEPMERVKKGQIIGAFNKTNDKEFYYSLSNNE